MRSQDTVQRSFNIKSFLARSSYMGSDFERRGWGSWSQRQWLFAREDGGWNIVSIQEDQ
jgi:hypothetical protein